ncbi:3',5'-cyclic-AMP phosphodiesterase [Oceanisphaera sp. DM8]|uniref:3',5'-cyclic adenosine monophosphate phosphodiesterase CpdA n=1 Tax=Oceanisphaera pacifica TaxID=2818389 RepID=A0ABS3ND44_9GAMM|nr:3',5'-cyclic-AMP phosphodiesterase [Oceanisphaera pacifica]MBO1518206.1 3',5'-cyclic-AMP phosphodiesterase [Oceanisphaera pacifica]
MNQTPPQLETIEIAPQCPSGVVELLQITDTHLFADKNADFLGIAPWQSGLAVVDAILENEQLSGTQPHDFILATGDLSQDHSRESYRHFSELMGKLAPPVFWLPGNHDDAVLMQAELDNAGISNAKHLLCGQWQILLLDTQLPGETHGELSAAQLSLLAQALQQYPEHHLLLAVHHQGIPVGCAWLDQHNLRNASAMKALLADHQASTVVLCGHVHQGFDQGEQGVRYLASPSTCIQFKPLSDEFALDTMAPGWRAMSLYPDGRLSTQVWRLPPHFFTPDFSATGY